MSSIKTAFMERIGLEVPILGFSHSIDVTSAISRAGGMGVYGIAHEPPEQVKPAVDAVRAAAGDRPIGADIMMPRNMPDTGTLEGMELIEDEPNPT